MNPIPRLSHRLILTGLATLIAAGSRSAAWANAIDPAHPPRPLEELFKASLPSGVGRLVIPIILTFSVETPIVCFLLRKNLSMRAAVLASIVMSSVVYPIVFYLYWWRGWGMAWVEVLTIGLESLLLLAFVYAALRVGSLVQSPTVARILSTAAAANLASWFAGWALLGR